MTTSTHSHKAWTDEGGHVKRTQSTSPRLRTPPLPDLHTEYPTRTPLRQVLGLGRQTVQRVLQ